MKDWFFCVFLDKLFELEGGLFWRRQNSLMPEMQYSGGGSSEYRDPTGGMGGCF